MKTNKIISNLGSISWGLSFVAAFTGLWYAWGISLFGAIFLWTFSKEYIEMIHIKKFLIGVAVIIITTILFMRFF